MLAVQPPEVMARMKDLVPDYLVDNPKLSEMLGNLEEEVDADYEFSLRKCIGEIRSTCLDLECKFLFVFSSGLHPQGSGGEGSAACNVDSTTIPSEVKSLHSSCCFLKLINVHAELYVRRCRGIMTTAWRMNSTQCTCL